MRIISVVLLFLAFASGADAVGPGCDYDAAAFRAELREEGSAEALRAEVFESPWIGNTAALESEFDYDLLLHVPLCLNDLDPDITTELSCDVNFSQNVQHYRNGDWQSGDRHFITLYGIHLGSSNVDAIRHIPLNLSHRAQAQLVSHVECRLQIGGPNSGPYRPIQLSEGEEVDASELYRTAAPLTPFRPTIIFNNTRSVERVAE